MRKVWTDNDIAYMIEHFANKPTQLVADQLGRSYRSVAAQANVMSLKKSAEFLKSVDSGRLGLKVAGMNTRFKKGQNTWNKGKKISEYLKPEVLERMKPTMFKKGQLPHNTLQDGVISTRKHIRGQIYQYIRVGLGKWVLYQRHLWEQAYGKIPDGHIVRFKDGNYLNTALENLECISKAENAIRNSIHRYPDEIKKLIKTNNKLKKQINQHHEKSSK